MFGVPSRMITTASPEFTNKAPNWKRGWGSFRGEERTLGCGCPAYPPNIVARLTSRLHGGGVGTAWIKKNVGGRKKEESVLVGKVYYLHRIDTPRRGGWQKSGESTKPLSGDP